MPVFAAAWAFLLAVFSGAISAVVSAFAAAASAIAERRLWGGGSQQLGPVSSVVAARGF